ncbi:MULTISPECIES: TRAP transporter small permease [Halomonadaceae]|uniref:TRAP transporter small permease protein n=2 Tax=Halomonadaceae TaxID=28256 RepID=A0AAP9NPH4_9GAMM|nr:MULTISPECIES: TRAP transporter small permease subunit [Halomonas]TMU23038.1 TRAP transporter small permease subunit [Halomonas sp. ATBC28]UEQ03756.1 TRAP transporter small permease subunit [Halomonas profundus]QKS25781.1 hypothetical protein FX987_03577 [Halomonas titanicae]CAD5275394.1 TRAP transporter, DctQ-like membrane protein [Halomonas sp. I3]CDG53019.1 TRAP transporter, DctQ-like membrane protein [Halomonas sp. A3H3]
MCRSIVILSDCLDWLARRVSVLCLVLMLLFVAIQVVARYAFNAPPSWTEEMARYMMVWGGLLGATLSFKSKDDPALFQGAMHFKSFPLRLFSALLRGVAVLIFFVPIIYFSILGSGMDPSRGFIARQSQISADTLGFPMSWVVLSVPICAAIILVHLLARACESKISKEGSTFYH